MSRNLRLVVILAGAGVVLLSIGLRPELGTPSSLSKTADGWLAARLYLEGRGDTVELLDHSDVANIGSGTLVTVFPWSSPYLGDSAESYWSHVRAGGNLIIATGVANTVLQEQVLDRFGFATTTIRGKPPLRYTDWRRYHRQTANLVSANSQHEIQIPLPRDAAVSPSGADVLFEDQRSGISVFAQDVGRGTVVVLPAAVLDNSGFRNDAGPVLLEELRRRYDNSWVFDEYHQGLRAQTSGEMTAIGAATRAWTIQILMLYVVALVALWRPFGGSWPAPQRSAGATAQYLLGLGATHQRLNHFGDAAKHLLARLQLYDRRFSATQTMTNRADGVSSGAELVSLAQDVADDRHCLPKGKR